MRILFYLILLISSNLFSQKIQGVLYDPNGEVSNFDINNVTQKIIKSTNENGYFEIEAKIGDSIIFESLGYKNQVLIASQEHFKEPIVIELKIDIQSLNEVHLLGYNKELDLKKINRSINESIKSDFEKHPYLYKPPPNSQGNLFAIFGLLYKALFKKKRPESDTFQKITFNDFRELFETDNVLNEKFLHEELKIPPEFNNLFFDYLDSLSWNHKLLDKENRLELIQKLYDSSSDYLKSISSTN